MLKGIRHWLKKGADSGAAAGSPSQTQGPDEFGIETDPGRIRHLLGDLRKTRALLTVRMSDVRHPFISSLLSIDASGGTLVLDELNPPGGHNMLTRREAFQVEGLLNGVPLSFRVEDYSIDEQDGISCYRIPIPSRVSYPQRRAGRRLSLKGPQQVLLQVRDAEGQERMTGELANISLGGIAAWIRGGQPEVGDELGHCRMRLPDGTPVDFALAIRYSKQLPKDGKTMIGGYFSVLPESELKKIERFILSLERSTLREHAGTLGPRKK